MTPPPLPEPVGDGYAKAVLINPETPSLSEYKVINVVGCNVFTESQMLQYAKDYHAAMLKSAQENNKPFVERRVRGEGA